MHNNNVLRDCLERRYSLYKHKPNSPEVSSEEYSIVMLGDFNPKIFQPSWFAAQQLIRNAEAEAATVDLIHPDFTSFSTEWFVLQVARERFSITVKSEAYKTHIKDLVFGTFQLLSHTPLQSMGINNNFVLKFKSNKDYHAFGNHVAPKSAWYDVIEYPGLRQLQIMSPRKDKLPGSTNLTIEPILTNNENQVVLRINQHFDIDKREENLGSQYFIGKLESDYDHIIEDCHKIHEDIIASFLKTDTFDGVEL